MPEIQRVSHHGLEIVVKSRRIRLMPENQVVTRYYAEICKRDGNFGAYITLAATQLTAENADEAIADAKAFLEWRP